MPWYSQDRRSGGTSQVVNPVTDCSSKLRKAVALQYTLPHCMAHCAIKPHMLSPHAASHHDNCRASSMFYMLLHSAPQGGPWSRPPSGHHAALQPQPAVAAQGIMAVANQAERLHQTFLGTSFVNTTHKYATSGQCRVAQPTNRSTCQRCTSCCTHGLSQQFGMSQCV